MKLYPVTILAGAMECFPLRGFKPHKNIGFMIFDLVFGVVIEYVCLVWNALFS